MTQREPLDFAGTVQALARTRDPEHVARIVGDDPRKQALAQWLETTLTMAPPATAEQRAGVAAILRGASTRDHERTP